MDSERRRYTRARFKGIHMYYLGFIKAGEKDKVITAWRKTLRDA